MFIIDTVKYRSTRHDISHVAFSDQYNTKYPGVLRNFINDYYFDEMVNWSLDGQKNYDQLCQVIEEFKSENIIGQNMYQHITPDVDYIWVKQNGVITIILEIGKRKICYLKNIVKIHNNVYYPDMFILITDLYSKMLMPFVICVQEILNHGLDNYDKVHISGYSINKLADMPIYCIRRSKINESPTSNTHQLISILSKDVTEWTRVSVKFNIVLGLLVYNNLETKFEK